MKKLLLFFSLILGAQSSFSQTFSTITPDSGYIFQNIPVTITTAGTNFMQGSPPQGYLWNGTTYIDLIGTSWGGWGNYLDVVNDTTVTGNVTIPANATSGWYDLHLEHFYDPWTGSSYTIDRPSAFYIDGTDGAISVMAFEDANQNGLRDTGETALNSQAINVTGWPTVYTNASGMATIPVTNGAHTVVFNSNSALTFAPLNASFQNQVVTVANDTVQVAIPCIRRLISVNPDSAFKSINNTIRITSSGLFTGPLTYSISITRNNQTYAASTYTVIDSNTIEANIFVQTVANVGLYDLRVFKPGNPSFGTHYLPASVNVVPSPVVVRGKVFIDLDLDGLYNNADIPLASHSVSLSPDSGLAITNNNGEYILGGLLGVKTTSWINGPSPDFVLSGTTPGTYVDTVNVPDTLYDRNFAVRYTAAGPTAEVLGFTGLPRCLVNNGWTIYYRTSSATVENGTLTFIKSPNVGFTNTYSGSVNGDTVTWSLVNIAPFTSFTQNILMLFPGIGDTARFTAIITLRDSLGNVTATDTLQNQYAIRCSFDPNDKQVWPAGILSAHYVLMDTELTYKIRFQNTGNDTAYDVLIRDTLHAALDLATFNFVASSHPVIIAIDENTRIAKFIFNNIYLPDSNVNEPASNGFIDYKIKPLTGLPAPTEVTNTAGIYFDLNPPVVTNTTLNTLVYVLPLGLSHFAINKDGSLFFPNPMEHTAQIQFKASQQEPFQLTIVNAWGQLVLQQSAVQSPAVIERNNLLPGVYVYTLTNGTTQYVGKFIVQ